MRAHVIPTGESALELLEATASDSPIARYLQKRGPGIHHITLRVDDIRAALDHLRARGVRLIDDQPRPGAQSALVAFIHPTSAHGVLVELKQAPRPHASLTAKRLPFGDLALTSVHDGLFGLDGGAMFGVVPRTLWASQSPPDDRNRILLATRPLLVEADWGRLLVDCGIGDKMDAKQRDIYAVIRDQALDEALASWDSRRIGRRGARHPSPFRSFRRRHGHGGAVGSSRALSVPAISSAPASGKTRPILTSAIEPATSRMISSR